MVINPEFSSLNLFNFQVLIGVIFCLTKYSMLRGSSDDGAVLCTQNATFSVKEAETSNSLLLVPSLALPTTLEKTGKRSLVTNTVEGVFYKYMEVLPAQPTTKRLHSVLREKSYKGGNSDQEHGWSLSELLDTVQASEEEILEGQFDVEVSVGFTSRCRSEELSGSQSGW